MIGISSDDPDVMCPDCKRLMILLPKYRGAIDAHGPGDGISDYVPDEDGFRGLIFLDGLINIIFAWSHRRKARRVCQQFEHFPRSLICPACLFVYRRR